jgi:hypothetical protein
MDEMDIGVIDAMEQLNAKFRACNNGQSFGVLIASNG